MNSENYKKGKILFEYLNKYNTFINEYHEWLKDKVVENTKLYIFNPNENTYNLITKENMYLLDNCHNFIQLAQIDPYKNSFLDIVTNVRIKVDLGHSYSGSIHKFNKSKDDKKLEDSLNNFLVYLREYYSKKGKVNG